MKCTLNSEYFEKKDQSQSLSITEIIDCETGCRTSRKRLATEMSKRPSFMQRFGSQHGNGYQTLLRSALNYFYTTIPLVCCRTSRKRLVLVRSEVLGQFANTSTVHYKYSR